MIWMYRGKGGFRAMLAGLWLGGGLPCVLLILLFGGDLDDFGGQYWWVLTIVFYIGFWQVNKRVFRVLNRDEAIKRARLQTILDAEVDRRAAEAGLSRDEFLKQGQERTRRGSKG